MYQCESNIAENFDNFYAMYCKIKEYGEKIAFIDGDMKKTYNDLSKDISKLVGAFDFKDKFILIKTASKYFFAVSYFATVLSQNIACLQDSNEIFKAYEGFDIHFIADDSSVTELLSESAETTVTSDIKHKMTTILCSSGTTFRPKAIALSSENLLTDLYFGMYNHSFKPNARYVSILPYFHAFGLLADLFVPLSTGSTIYCTYNMFDFLTALPQFDPTALNLTPGAVNLLLTRLQYTNDKTKVVGKSLKSILSGGAETPADLAQQMRFFEISVYGCYGLTECSPCVAISGEQGYKDGSSGKIIGCNRISLDRETGVITVSGSNVMLGYLDKHGNLCSISERNFVTNDIGYIDEDGFLYVLGRKDELMVLSDGTKRFPQEIEKKINSICGVCESLVYQEADNICALIVVEKNADIKVISSSVANQNYDGIKLHKIQTTVEPLKKTNLGKIIRKKNG